MSIPLHPCELGTTDNFPFSPSPFQLLFCPDLFLVRGMFRYCPAVQISSFPSLLSYRRCQHFAKCCSVTMTSIFWGCFAGEERPLDDEREFLGDYCDS